MKTSLTVIIDIHPFYGKSRKVAVTYDCNKYSLKTILVSTLDLRWLPSVLTVSTPEKG